MSVFAQYVPHTFASGDWDSRRVDVRNLAIGSIARFCENIPEAIIDVQVLGPPDIEREVGLDRWAYLPGGMSTGEYVGQTVLAPDADAWCFPLRSLHLPRRKRHRHQRAECGDGDFGGGVRIGRWGEGEGARMSKRKSRTEQEQEQEQEQSKITSTSKSKSKITSRSEARRFAELRGQAIDSRPP